MQMLLKDIILTPILALLATLVSYAVFLFLNTFQKRLNSHDSIEIKYEVDKKITQIQNSKNVIDLMVQNVAELREYYIISKQQANRSFTSSLLVCFLGFILFVTGIVISCIGIKGFALYTTI